MKGEIGIDVILDPAYEDLSVTIRTKERTEQVNHIVEAIEQAAQNEFPPIPATNEDRITLLPQRELVRIYTQGRKVLVQTDESIYYVNKSLSYVEEMLNPDRFLRISQSEIVNIRKVKNFEFSVAGTIGIEFENGDKSWVSRSRMKAIKDLLKEYE